MKSAGHLTLRRIANLALGDDGLRYVVWDTALPGFGVRVSGSAKTFVLKYRLAGGRVRWATLGRFGVVTLEQAHARARAYLGVVAGGDDPQRRKDLAREAPTLSTVSDRFLADHVRTRLKPKSLQLYRTCLEKHIRPLLGAVAIADITRVEVVRLHNRLRPTPVMANRALAVLSKLMNWAEQHSYRDTNSNPCHGVKHFREQPRQRYLTLDEMKRLGAALRVLERWHAMSPTVTTAIKLLLLTGARVSEILSLRWREVDFASGALHLADSKTGRKTIVLSAPAIEILKAWPRYAGSPYVFPGEGRGWRKGKHRVSLADGWTRIRRRARIVGVRIHDLRHSYASVAVSGGQTLPMIGALLGHKQAATTQRYAHLMQDPLRAATNATGATIAAAIGARRPR